MKKLLYLAVFAVLLFSCNKENAPATSDSPAKTFSFTAGIESLAAPTKADVDASNGLVWAENDKIGIYVNDASWTDKNQPFTLEGSGGSAAGTFIWDYDNGNFTNENASAAFFPWTGSGSSYNNVYEGVVYFKLGSEFWSYTSGKMLTPLVAKLNNSSEAIEFKHAGAAVKLTINNLPSNTYHVNMAVEGEQITGDFHIDPASAGTAALALDGSADATKNNITLHTWKGNGAFDWIFPVPELTKPKLTFTITDDNGVTVWSKKLKAQANDLTRGDLLVMPALSITPYSQFKEASTTWTFCGTINGSAWKDDVKMMTDGKICILTGYTFKVGDEFKIRKDGKWDEAYPSSNWAFTVETGAGAKDIIFNTETHEIKVVDAKYPYPAVQTAASITIDGDLSDWEDITGATVGNNTLKVSSDENNIYLYSSRANQDRYSEIWGGGGYVYFTFDLDNDGTGAGEIYGNKADMVILTYPYAGSASEYAFYESPQSNWACSPTDYSIANIVLKGVADSNAASFELSIPRTDLPAMPSGTITIKTFGNKDMSTVTLNRSL